MLFLGSDGRNVMTRVRDIGNSRDFMAEYTPNVPGMYKIDE